MQIFLAENGGTPWRDGLTFSNTAVALGCFDAMHRGHCAILQEVVVAARREGLTPAVYFFVNRPRTVLGGTEIPGVCSMEQRLARMEELGIGLAIGEEFNEEYLKKSPEEFVTDYLHRRLGARFVAAGYNYRFGRYGRGDLSVLTELCRPYGIAVCGVPCVTEAGEAVSGTRIRRLVAAGELDEAAACLGRPFALEGRVISGNQIGRTMGFPTANLELWDGMLLPRRGVYQTEARLDTRWWPAITNVGERPTVDGRAVSVETHILGFSGDLYGKRMEVRFLRYLREIVRFGSLAELKAQLARDVAIWKK